MLSEHLEAQTLKKYKVLNTFVFKNYMLNEAFNKTFKIRRQPHNTIKSYAFIKIPPANETI